MLILHKFSTTLVTRRLYETISGLQCFNVTFLYQLSLLGTSTEVIPKKVPGTRYYLQWKTKEERFQVSRAELTMQWKRCIIVSCSIESFVIY